MTKKPKQAFGTKEGPEVYLLFFSNSIKQSSKK